MAASSQWLFWALLSAVFAALTAIFAKAGLQDINSDFATLVRTAMILLVLAAFVLGSGKWRPPASVSASTWGWLLASALATGASWVCYFRALQAGDASKVAAVDKGSLVLVALFALAFLHERLDSREWLGVGLVSAGIVLMAFKR
ncbi:transporter [Pseudoxanthomonas yeongjuensis]|uniref:EamA family transporter n=1 Tax=Pseudoxanthomonas yeongjuensis TaxID=377616 RepID=UPI001391E3FA|nr:EamA family transporter [Pseudoxanthomonas yeongjuensis]KAF1716476.1 transporter [Pseudoxanthomonas yeongjuensis]